MFSEQKTTNMTGTDQPTIMLDNVQLTNTSDTAIPENRDSTIMPGSTQTTPSTTKPFRFLDLPVDIRMMVYEQLIPDFVDQMLAQTKQREINLVLDGLKPADVDVSAFEASFNKTINDRVIEEKRKKTPAILHVCKLTRCEATPMYTKQLERFRYAAEPRSRLDFGLGFRMLFRRTDWKDAVAEREDRVRLALGLDFGSSYTSRRTYTRPA